MTVIVRNREGQKFVITKGAPDVLISRCTSVQVSGEVKSLSMTMRSKWDQTVSRMAKKSIADDCCSRSTIA